MTTGTITQGADGQARWYTKTWSGGDGKYSNGVLQQHAYTMSCTNHVSSKGTKPSGAYISAGMGLYSQLTTWNANDDLKVLSKLSEKARNHSFNLGVAMAEAPQTLKLIAVTLTRFNLAIRALRNGRVDHAFRSLGVVPTPEMLKKHKGDYEKRRRRSREFQLTNQMSTKDVSSMWLEIQYGWKPMLSDIHESMRAYAAHTDPPRRSRYSVTVSRSSERILFPTGSTAVRVFTQNTVSKTIHVHQKETLSVARSLGLADPRAIIWEKIPFSFVADWFIPIGSYLDSLATIPFISASFIVVTKDVSRGTGLGGTDQFGTQNYIGAYASGSRISYTRTVSGSLTVPLPKFKPLDEALSIGHIKNGIALLHQLLK